MNSRLDTHKGARKEGSSTSCLQAASVVKEKPLPGAPIADERPVRIDPEKLAWDIANYIGSEGDHNTRESVRSIMALLDDLRFWIEASNQK